MTVHIWGSPDEDIEEPGEAICDYDRAATPDTRVIYHYRYRITGRGYYVCVICGETNQPKGTGQ